MFGGFRQVQLPGGGGLSEAQVNALIAAYGTSPGFPASAIVSGEFDAARIPNLAASKITSGQLALARGGTNADLSATGGATHVLAQDASHVITARALIAADIPSLSSIYQPLDSDLTALAGLNSTGFARQAGSGTWTIVGETGTGSVARADAPSLTGTPTITPGTQGGGLFVTADGLLTIARVVDVYTDSNTAIRFGGTGGLTAGSSTHFLVVGDSFATNPGRLEFRYSNYTAFSQVSGGSFTEKIRFTSAGDVGIGASTPGAKLHVRGSGVVTNAVVNVERREYDSSGTPANGLGISVIDAIESNASAGTFRDAAVDETYAVTITDASRAYGRIHSVYSVSAKQPYLQAIADSGGVKTAVNGATPVARAAHIADPTGGTTQDAESRTAINAILAALENFGILLTS